MKIRRDVLLVILIPLLFVFGIRFILALSFSGGALEEKITIYDVDYVPSDFELQKVVVVNYNGNNDLTVDFKLTGGDGAKDLEFTVYCQDLNHIRLHSISTNSGTISLIGLNSQYTTTTNINYGDEMGGSLYWADIPSGEQTVRLLIQLENIYIDTWTFFVEMRNE